MTHHHTIPTNTIKTHTLPTNQTKQTTLQHSPFDHTTSQMALTNWLGHALDFPKVWDLDAMIPREDGTKMLAVDIREDDDKYIVHADLPGYRADEIDLKVEDGTLKLAASRKREHEEKSDTFHRVERFHGQVYRAIALPDNANEEAINAKCNDGVLEVTIAKKPESKPKARTIAVTGGAAGAGAGAGAGADAGADACADAGAGNGA